MGEVIAGVVIFLAVLVAVFVAVFVGDAPGRATRQQTRLKAVKEVRASANHQQLFLLVNDLVLLQERGYVEVFPDPETLARAKTVLANYRQEIGP